MMTRRLVLASTSASWTAASPPPTTATSWPRKKPPSQVAQCETPRPVSSSSPATPSLRSDAPEAMITASGRYILPASSVRVSRWPASSRAILASSTWALALRTSSSNGMARSWPANFPGMARPSTSSTVATWPPNIPRPSNRVTRRPLRATCRAANSPARPPPMTATSQRFLSGLMGVRCFLRVALMPGDGGRVKHAPIAQALSEANGVEMIEQGHGELAGNAERGRDLGDQQSGLLREQWLQTAPRLFDGIAMEQDFLALRPIDGADDDAVPHQALDGTTGHCVGRDLVRPGRAKSAGAQDVGDPGRELRLILCAGAITLRPRN